MGSFRIFDTLSQTDVSNRGPAPARDLGEIHADAVVYFACPVADCPHRSRNVRGRGGNQVAVLTLLWAVLSYTEPKTVANSFR